MMTEIEDRRNEVLLCKRDNLSTADAEKDVVDDEHGVSRSPAKVAKAASISSLVLALKR